MVLSKLTEFPSPRDDENEQSDKVIPKKREGPGRALMKEEAEHPALFFPEGPDEIAIATSFVSN